MPDPEASHSLDISSGQVATWGTMLLAAGGIIRHYGGKLMDFFLGNIKADRDRLAKVEDGIMAEWRADRAANLAQQQANNAITKENTDAMREVARQLAVLPEVVKSVGELKTALQGVKCAGQK